MNHTKKLNIIMYSIIMFLYSCDYGPKAILNDDFVRANPAKELPFKNLVGTYELDNDSKKRYGISDEDNSTINIEKDTFYIIENSVDYKHRKINYGKFKYRFGYVNNYKEQHANLFFNSFNKDFNGGGSIKIYYRKRDRIIALYILTPFVPASKENNMKYFEADYLRYIKVK